METAYDSTLTILSIEENSHGGYTIHCSSPLLGECSFDSRDKVGYEVGMTLPLKGEKEAAAFLQLGQVMGIESKGKYERD